MREREQTLKSHGAYSLTHIAYVYYMYVCVCVYERERERERERVRMWEEDMKDRKLYYVCKSCSRRVSVSVSMFNDSNNTASTPSITSLMKYHHLEHLK